VARTEAHLHAKFHLDPSSRLATIRWPKVGGCYALCFFGGRREMGPYLTQCGFVRGLGSVPSGILIHPAVFFSFILIYPTVWPQYQHYRQIGQDRQTSGNGRVRQGEPFYKWTPKIGDDSSVR